MTVSSSVRPWPASLLHSSLTSCFTTPDTHTASAASQCHRLTLNFLVVAVSTLDIQTHSSKEAAEFSFGNAEDKSTCCYKQRTKSKLSFSAECVETKLCKPRTSFTSHLHCLRGMVWYRTFRVKHHDTLDSLHTSWMGRKKAKRRLDDCTPVGWVGKRQRHTWMIAHQLDG